MPQILQRQSGKWNPSRVVPDYEFTPTSGQKTLMQSAVRALARIWRQFDVAVTWPALKALGRLDSPIRKESIL